jgi:hypothetical protein
MELVRRDAELIYVGKERDNHSVPQDGINQLLVDLAKQGRRVCRLKCSLLLSGISFDEPNWLWLTFFVGFNLFQSAFTCFCPAAKIFKAMGMKDVNCC